MSAFCRRRRSYDIAAVVGLALLVTGPVTRLPPVTHADGRLAARTAAASRLARPVLAFYYSWFHPQTWSSARMSDLPTRRYESSDEHTIERQVREAAQAGITGFAASWTGPHSQENDNFARVLAYAATYQRQTGTHFVACVYLETDLLSQYGHNLYGAMRYAVRRYTSNPHYFRWRGKPVFFIWDALGQGRTLSTWIRLRRLLDPQRHLIWVMDSARPLHEPPWRLRWILRLQRPVLVPPSAGGHHRLL